MWKPDDLEDLIEQNHIKSIGKAKGQQIDRLLDRFRNG